MPYQFLESFYIKNLKFVFKVSNGESNCALNCAEKYLKMNQRISTRFQVRNEVKTSKVGSGKNSKVLQNLPCPHRTCIFCVSSLSLTLLICWYTINLLYLGVSSCGKWERYGPDIAKWWDVTNQLGWAGNHNWETCCTLRLRFDVANIYYGMIISYNIFLV